MVVLYILIALIILLLLITIHELGHYLVGRKLGFKIEEFAVGFGKVIWQKVNKRGEKISLRLIPLGGYCAFYGEEGQTQDENGKIVETKDPDAFTSQKPWKRILVFLAGVTFNFLTAIIFSFILLVSFGYGNVYKVNNVNEYFLNDARTSNQLYMIDKNDKILAINGTEINYVWEKTVENLVTDKTPETTYVLTILKAETGEVQDVRVEIQYNKQLTYNAETETYETAVDENNNPIYDYGMGLDITLSSMPLSFWDALLECFSLAIGFAWLVLKTLWLLITFQLPLSALGGTATVISTVASNMAIDLSVILVYLPLLSVNLAIMNALPLPALDGGHVVFTTIEAIRKKPINRNVEAICHFVGLILLFGFVILLDLIHFFG